jgi:hypothetical protein
MWMLSGCCEALARLSEHTARILIWTVKTQFGVYNVITSQSFLPGKHWEKMISCELIEGSLCAAAVSDGSQRSWRGIEVLSSVACYRLSAVISRLALYAYRVC